MNQPANSEQAQLVPLQDIGELIVAADPERWLAVTYARKTSRAALASLFALDISLGRVVASTTEPMIGAMRLAWWREALESLHLPPYPAEPVLQAVAAEWIGPSVNENRADLGAAFAAMVEGWVALIEVDKLDETALLSHANERGGRLFTLAADALGADFDTSQLWRMGSGWALVDLASHLSQTDARTEALAMAADYLKQGFAGLPSQVRPLVAMAVLARRDALKGLEGRRIGSPGRQLRMLAALMSGK